MIYTEYRYLYPPRPERAIAPTNLAQIEAMGWWGQAKMNGTCCTIYVSPERQSVAFGRHGVEHRLDWQPGPRWDAFVSTLPGKGWYVFVGELLHSKVKGGPRDTVYLFDILVNDSHYLIGKKYRDRYCKLQDLCDVDSSDQIYSVVTPGVWIANNQTTDFGKLFANPHENAVEGLVFKNPEASLLTCGRATSNQSWQVKCRYAKANLSF